MNAENAEKTFSKNIRVLRSCPRPIIAFQGTHPND
jgi:hypothetical protein